MTSEERLREIADRWLAASGSTPEEIACRHGAEALALLGRYEAVGSGAELETWRLNVQRLLREADHA